MKLLTAFLCTISINSTGQIQLPLPRNIESAYINGTRDNDGVPGQNYWQNRAVYNIKVRFDPATRQINGTVNIEYKNNSPDSLDMVLIKLYPNIFKKGAIRDVVLNEKDVGGGVVIEEISIGGNMIDLKKLKLQGTNMFIPIEKLVSGKSAKFEIIYSYQLSKDSPLHRTGQIDESSFFVAYFFPRIAVYDDIDGWNRNQFLGTTEFYNDFSDFRVSISVPSQYVVWATGDLLNCQDVLSKQICERLSLAEITDDLIHIIDSNDIKAQNVTVDPVSNTFIYEAKNVTDFAFATSNHYIWNATSVEVNIETERRTRIDAVYNPEHDDFQDVVNIARRTVEAISYYYPKWSFPYNHETIFEGHSEMEFPMMVNNHPSPDFAYTILLTIHEIFHTMFPFYIGTNETKYAWMDEGWAVVGEWLIYTYLYPNEVNKWGVPDYERTAGNETDYPIMTLSTQLTENNYLVNSYFKPALGFLYIQDMLGEDRFFDGLHHFIKSWSGKHPIPWDLFNCINYGSRVNLNWFWKAWFFDDGFPDLAIENVTVNDSETQVVIKMKGSKPVPVNLIVTYSDDSTEIIHKSISTWKKGNKETAIEIKSNKKISKLILDGTHIPDINKADNIWLL